GAEGIGEEQQEAAEQRRRQDRQGDVEPVAGRRGPEAGRRLTPFALQPEQRRDDQEDEQRQLEIDVGDRQPGYRIEGEPGIEIEADRLQQQRDDAGRAERDDEGEGERRAAEVRG